MSASLRGVVTGTAIVLTAALLALGLTRLSVIKSLERLSSDLRIAAFQAPMPQSTTLAVVAVTEQTLHNFQYRSPIDRRFLADLLLRLDAMGARAIALDILLDQATEPHKDEALAQALRSLRTPIFVSYTRSPEMVDDRQQAFLDQYVPPQLRATADFLRDPIDGAVRWVNPGGDGLDPAHPRGLSTSIAERLGHSPLTTPLEIAWRPRPDRDTPPFPIYAAHSVGDLPEGSFRDRVIMVGGIVSLEDRHRTPLGFASNPEDQWMAGILIHAHSLSQLLESRRLPSLGPLAAFAIAILLALLGHLISLRRGNVVISVLGALTLLGGFWVAALFGYRAGGPLIPLVAPSLALGFGLWFSDLVLDRRERLRRRFLQQAFSRYVSPAVVKQLLDHPEQLKVTGQRRNVTFIFTDIEDFTALAEQMDAEALSKLLNDYLDGCCRIVFEYEGTIDKFIGDSVMAVFNAPLEQPDHPERALRCAIELQRWTASFREACAQRGVALGTTRIGVHSGIAMVGNFGSQMRMDFTSLGDTVNVASRVEGINRLFGTRLICTETVARSCRSIPLLDLGPVLLYGRRAPIRLYTPATEAQIAQGFAAAWSTLRANLDALAVDDGRVNPDTKHAPGTPDARSAHLLQEIARQYPDEPIVCFFLNRAHAGEVWTSVTSELK